MFYLLLFYVGYKLALYIMACFGVNILLIYPLIRVLSPYPCFIPPSMFYLLNRVLSPHPCFVPSSMFYPLIRVLSPHPCFIPSFVFYPPIRVLSPHPCFIPPSVFYPLIRVLSPHPCLIYGLIPSSMFYPLFRTCFIPSSVSVPSVYVSVSVFYPNQSQPLLESVSGLPVHSTKFSWNLHDLSGSVPRVLLLCCMNCG